MVTTKLIIKSAYVISSMPVNFYNFREVDCFIRVYLYFGTVNRLSLLLPFCSKMLVLAGKTIFLLKVLTYQLTYLFYDFIPCRYFLVLFHEWPGRDSELPSKT